MKNHILVILLTSVGLLGAGLAANAQTPAAGNVTPAPARTSLIRPPMTDEARAALADITVFDNLQFLLNPPYPSPTKFYQERRNERLPPKLIKVVSTVRGVSDRGTDMLTGTIELVDPLNITRTLQRLSFSFPDFMGRAGGGKEPYAWPGSRVFDKTPPAYALCELNLAQVLAGNITTYPDVTVVIPNAWAADIGKLLGAPDPATFYAAPKTAPADLHAAGKWAVLVYASHLWQDDFPAFVREYPRLFNGGDVYLGALVTHLLINGAIKNKADVSKEMESVLQNPAATPDQVTAIVMAVFRNARTYDAAEVQKLVALARQRAEGNAPEWAGTRAMLGLSGTFL